VICLVSPLISALHIHAVHIHAVAQVRAGRTPRLSNIVARGLQVLPTAAATINSTNPTRATTIMTTLGIPGSSWACRWYVAVQSAAIERKGWLPALRRSRQLTEGVYGHLFAFAILIGITGEVPLAIGRAGVTGHDALAAAFIGGVTLHAFALAFTALATALRYFGLAFRRESALPQGPAHPARAL
jgi:hypothetical protein